MCVKVSRMRIANQAGEDDWVVTAAKQLAKEEEEEKEGEEAAGLDWS